MAIKRLKNVWSWLSNSFKMMVAMRQTDGYILLLRLENTEFLTHIPGKNNYLQILTRISSRIFEGMGAKCEVHHMPDGTFIVRLPGITKTEAMLAARQAQLHGEHELAVSHQTITPVLSGVVLPQSSAIWLKNADPIGQGRKILEQIESDRLGQISYVDLPAMNTDATASRSTDPRITPMFQPLLCCDSNRVAGFELHIGTNRPISDSDSPFPALRPRNAREDEMPLGKVLQEAARALRFWDEAGAEIRHISINIPELELLRSGFAARLNDQLLAIKLPPDRLNLRLNIENNSFSTSALKDNIRLLREIGCPLELNRFGMGQAGLDTLRRLEVDAIRIDPGFVFCCDMDPVQQPIVRAILAMAEQMRLGTIAEGVDSPEEHTYLAQLGCQLVQGCAIAPPMQLEETLGFLARQHKKAGSVPNIGPAKFG